ncbi:MAG: metallophosphoesterase [Acidobacteriota bacterium]|nr:metallophosphoesterase [Acidobacteriota bacterium]
MAHRTPQQAQALERLHRHGRQQLAARPAAKTSVTGLGRFLVESEEQLIALMNDTAPPTGGEVEFGMVLYWIHNDLPSDPFFRWLASLFPPTQITPEEVARWEKIWQGPGVVAPDGTLVGYGTFEQLDKGWLYSTVLYLLTILTSELPKAPFGTSPAEISVGSGSALRIAVIGDWGTGAWNDGGTQGPAAEIMQQIEALTPQPDLVIHVGDVYYSGTGDLPWVVSLAMTALSAEIGVPFLSDEETVRLVNSWWCGGKAGNSFTLNSNHEMYSAARGYFHDGLEAAVFGAQKNTSYFALSFQDWVILGLDSAYYSNSFAVMEGRLQDADHTEQVQWVQSLDLQGKRVIVLTHHTGLTYDGQPITSTEPTLWDDVKEALGGKGPDYWYWGHVHNGIVYTANALGGTKARCLGHGALPFGNAYFWQNGQKHDLGQSPSVEYYAHTPKPNPHHNPRWDNRVLNGFALLTLGPGTLTEAFYEQGNPRPVWTASS